LLATVGPGVIPLAVVESAPHVGRSPTPSQSPSPSTEAEAKADGKADTLAKAEAVADIWTEDEAESDGSPGYVMMDLEEDHLHGYAMPALLGPILLLRVSLYGSFVCPVYPNHKSHGWWLW
jgi:hypothetical protein